MRRVRRDMYGRGGGGRRAAGAGAFLVALCGAAAASAEGFAIDDLQSLAVETTGFEGGAFEAKATSADRLTVFCLDCEVFTAIDILLGRSTDGTEQRFRSGATTLARIEALCKARAPLCEIEGAESGGAVGWISRYPLAGLSGSTVILFQDGDMLTIRSVSEAAERAESNARHALETIAPQIVGAAD